MFDILESKFKWFFTLMLFLLMTVMTTVIVSAESANKQLKNSLQEASNELIAATIDSLAKSITGSPGASDSQTSGMGQNRTEPDSTNRFSAGVTPPSNARSAKSQSNDMECSKCGHSAAFFPYADSRKKTLKCPSCGERKNLR